MGYKLKPDYSALSKEDNTLQSRRLGVICRFRIKTVASAKSTKYHKSQVPEVPSTTSTKYHKYPVPQVASTTSTMSNTLEKLCVQWRDFKENANELFKTLREDQDFTDVTLVSEDGDLEVDSHKLILTGASPVF